MKVAVLGAGSVGCFVGACWSAAGIDVTLIGRRRIGDELAAHGLTASDGDGWGVSLAPDRVRFAAEPRAMRGADLIALAVKRADAERAAREIARHAGRDAAVLCLQNGVDIAEALRPLLGRRAAIEGMVPYNVVHPAPGHWRRTTWGELAAARHPAIEALAAAVGDRPGRLALADDMRAVKWGKLLLNLNNAVNALSGVGLLEELRQRDFRRVLAAAMLETLALLDAAGIVPAKIGPIPPRLLPHAVGAPDLLFNNLLLRVQRIAPGARSSMADDIAAGRATEVDWLNGEVVRLAARLGRTAPVNAAIAELVHQAEAGVERRWTAQELRDAVLSGHKRVALFGY